MVLVIVISLKEVNMNELIKALAISLLSFSCLANDSTPNNNPIYLIQGDKIYKVLDIGGELLVSNEWTPLYESGYTDEYIEKIKKDNVRHANNFIKQNRGY